MNWSTKKTVFIPENVHQRLPPSCGYPSTALQSSHIPMELQRLSPAQLTPMSFCGLEDDVFGIIINFLNIETISAIASCCSKSISPKSIWKYLEYFNDSWSCHDGNSSNCMRLLLDLSRRDFLPRIQHLSLTSEYNAEELEVADRLVMAHGSRLRGLERNYLDRIAAPASLESLDPSKIEHLKLLSIDISILEEWLRRLDPKFPRLRSIEFSIDFPGHQSRDDIWSRTQYAIERINAAAAQLEKVSWDLVDVDQFPLKPFADKFGASSLKTINFGVLLDHSDENAKFEKISPLLGRIIHPETTNIFDLSAKKLNRCCIERCGIPLSRLRVFGRSIWYCYVIYQSENGLEYNFKYLNTLFNQCFPANETTWQQRIEALQVLVDVDQQDAPENFFKWLKKASDTQIEHLELSELSPSALRPVVGTFACLCSMLTQSSASNAATLLQSTLAKLRRLISLGNMSAPITFFLDCVNENVLDDALFLLPDLLDDPDLDAKVNIFDRLSNGKLVASLFEPRNYDLLTQLLQSAQYDATATLRGQPDVLCLTWLLYEITFSEAHTALFEALINGLVSVRVQQPLVRPPDKDYLPSGCVEILFRGTNLRNSFVRLFPEWPTMLDVKQIARITQFSGSTVAPRELVAIVEGFCQATTGSKDLSKELHKQFALAYWRSYLDSSIIFQPSIPIELFDLLGVPPEIVEEIKGLPPHSEAYKALVEVRVIRK